MSISLGREESRRREIDRENSDDSWYALVSYKTVTTTARSSKPLVFPAELASSEV